jgi:hypothetical protein
MMSSSLLVETNEPNANGERSSHFIEEVAIKAKKFR